MLLQFRQGLVQVQSPTFFKITFPYVDLLVSDTNIIVAFAAGTKDYLYTEQESVPNAWGPLVLGKDQWLYWDIDVRTGLRSFGITLHEPIVSSIPPTNPATDQHWFNLTTTEMSVWTGHGWSKRIRTFAFKLTQGKVPVSLSVNAPSYIGTQIGAIGPYYAGHILFDATTNNALKDSTGKFVTTETQLSTKAISLSEVKLASIIIEGEAQQNMASHTVVVFTEFGKIVHADQFTAEQTRHFGLIETSAVVGQVVPVTHHGMITSDSWDWSSAGVNALLYANSSGALTTTPVIPNQLPIGTVLDRRTIMLGSPVAQISGGGDVALATQQVYGITRLSVPAVDDNDPIAVGDNDPRLTNARPPAFHTHPIEQVIDLQSALDNKIDIAGDRMTGPLILHADPTTELQATTKQYVDNTRTHPAGSTWQIQYNTDGYFDASDNLSIFVPNTQYSPFAVNVGSDDFVSATVTTKSISGNIQLEGGGKQNDHPGSAILQGGVLFTTTEYVPPNGPGSVSGGHACVIGGPAHGPMGRAGDAWIRGGSGDLVNGRVIIDGGTNYDNVAQKSTTNGGSVQITGGAAQGTNCEFGGGSVVIAGGRAEGTGTPGAIEFQTDELTRLIIDEAGAFLLENGPGQIGQVIASQGSTKPPKWVDVPSGSASPKLQYIMVG